MNYEEAKKLFTSLFKHEMSDEQMRELLLSIKLDEHTSVETIAAAAEVMRSFAVELPIAEELRSKVIDIVGTGGDKIGSFNISSTVAIIAASCGSMVAKHGSRSVTSKSGSADMFEELKDDYRIEDMAKYIKDGVIYAYDIVVEKSKLKKVLKRLEEFNC